MIKAVLIDAMSTIFRFKEELTKYEMLQRLIIEYLKEKISISRIKKVYDRKRAKFEPWGGQDHLEKWILINKEILLALFKKMEESRAESLGKFMAKKLASDSSLYRVSKDTKIFLREAGKRGIEIIIASNQDSDCLNDLIKDFDLRKLLSQVYTSTEIGLEKPDPRFFQRILKKEGLLSQDCLMIGNNPKNDIVAARKVGLIGVLLDPRNLYPEHKGYRISQLGDFWKLDISKRS